MFRPILTHPPAEYPVTLAEVKAQAVVDFDDDDELLTALRDAAVAHLDGFRGVLGRAIITQTWSLSREAWCRDVLLPVPDVSAVEITYSDSDGDTQTVSTGDYSLNPVARGTLMRMSDDFDRPLLDPGNIAPISVEFTCGFGGADAVPSDLKLAIKALAASWYEARGTEPGQSIPLGIAPIVEKYRWAAL